MYHEVLFVFETFMMPEEASFVIPFFIDGEMPF